MKPITLALMGLVFTAASFVLIIPQYLWPDDDNWLTLRLCLANLAIIAWVLAFRRARLEESRIPSEVIRWDDQACDRFHDRAEKLLDLHTSPHTCVDGSTDFPCMTFRIVTGREDA
jgi:hypothetical protein